MDKEGFRDTVKYELGFEGVKEFKSQHGAGEGIPACTWYMEVGGRGVNWCTVFQDIKVIYKESARWRVNGIAKECLSIIILGNLNFIL